MVRAFIAELETTAPPDAERVRKQRQAPRPDWSKLDLPAIDSAYRRFWLAQTGTARQAFAAQHGPDYLLVIANDLPRLLAYCRHVLQDQRDHGTWPRPDACRLLCEHLSHRRRFDLARRVEMGFERQVIRSDGRTRQRASWHQSPA